jgi:hypothetical protein
VPAARCCAPGRCLKRTGGELGAAPKQIRDGKILLAEIALEERPPAEAVDRCAGAGARQRVARQF